MEIIFGSFDRILVAVCDRFLNDTPISFVLIIATPVEKMLGLKGVRGLAIIAILSFSATFHQIIIAYPEISHDTGSLPGFLG